MKYCRFCLLISFIFTTFSFVQGQPPPPPPAPVQDYFPERWPEYSIPEYGFSVKSPRPLKKTVELPETNPEGVRWVIYSAGSNLFIAYSISIRELGVIRDEAEAAKVFDQILAYRTARYSPKSEVLGKEDTEFSGFPARSAEFEASGKRVRDLIVIRGRLLYVVEVITSSKDGPLAMKAKDAYKEIADGFRNSFVFKEPSLAESVSTTNEADPPVWKPFVSDDDSFSIQWPGQPAKSSAEIKTASRIVPQNEYFLRTNLVLYGVVVQAYNMNYEDKAGLENLFSSWRNGFLSRSGGTVVSDKTISFAGVTAREVKFESEKLVLIGRAFFLRGRFYTATVSYEKIYEPLPKIKRVIDDSIAKFFGSMEVFSPKSLRDLVAEELKLPEDFFGDTTNGIYKNSFFGFQLKLPENWIVSSRENNQILVQVSKDALSVQNPAILAQLKSAEKPILTVSKKRFGAIGNPSLMIDTNRYATSNINLEGTARLTELTFAKIPNSRTTKPTQMMKLDKRTVYFFEREAAGGNMVVKQRISLIQHNNYVVTFVLSYLDDADLAVLESAMRSIKFSK